MHPVYNPSNGRVNLYKSEKKTEKPTASAKCFSKSRATSALSPTGIPYMSVPAKDVKHCLVIMSNIMTPYILAHVIRKTSLMLTIQPLSTASMGSPTPGSIYMTDSDIAVRLGCIYCASY